MIKIGDQAVFDLKIGSFKDPIKDPRDLFGLKIIQEAGAILPTVEVVFNTGDMELLKHLNSLSTMSVTVGQSPTDTVTINCKIASRQLLDDRDSARVVRLTGVLAKTGFNFVSISSIYEDKTSLEVMNAIASKYFKWVSNIDNLSSGNDRNNWIQSFNMTDKAMFTKAWLHSDHSDDNILTAITLEGEMLVHSVDKIVSQSEPDWVFTSSVSTGASNEIIYAGSPRITTNPGLSSMLGAAKKKRIIHNLDE